MPYLHFKMERNIIGIFLRAFIFCLILSFVNSQSLTELIRLRDPSVFQGFEVLDSNGNYVVTWTVNWDQRRIIFETNVRTRGFVAFGLSQVQDIAGADVVIGGVDSNGVSYFTDRHAVNDRTLPEVDASQDWLLHEALENSTHTFLRFSRAIDTCDEDDQLINDWDTVYLVWTFGRTDNPTQEWNLNPSNHGFYPVYLLDPDVTPRPIKEAAHRLGPPPQAILNDENLRVWTVTARTRIPPAETNYMCTMHQAPRLPRMHHIVGFNTRLETQEAYQHTHHLIFYRCSPPTNTTAANFFGRYVNAPGETCYFLARPSGQIPTQYCTTVVSGYGIGGRIHFFPDVAGIPFALARDEFYVLQVHYDNPEIRNDIEYDIHLDIYYTPQLRPNELGIMTIGHHIPGSPSILIPPDTPAHDIFGHCSPDCTERILPEEGINIVGLALHTHYAGRKARIHHVRGNDELPWLGEDSNYDATFQNYRVLRVERNVRRGDHLIMECEFTSEDANGTVVGGFSTRQEMCLTYVLYYNRLEDYSLCRSEIADPYYLRKYLGANNITWSQEALDYVATSPPRVAGLSMAEISDTRVRWTETLRSELQYDHQFLPQVNACSRSPFSSSGQGQVEGGDELTSTISYPLDLNEYVPPGRFCSAEQGIPNFQGDIVNQIKGNARTESKIGGRLPVSFKSSHFSSRNNNGWGWKRF